MANPLRIGMIGLGDVAVAHLEGYRGITDARVVAGADPRRQRVDALAARFGFTPYSDYREMLSKERPDIACVLTPVNTHREVVEAAADRRVRVFCEKPLAVRLEDADAVIRRCQDCGLTLFYAASYRYLPPLVTARGLISAGRLGEVHLLTETLVGGHGPDHVHRMGFERHPEGGPGGSGWGLVDHGIHLVDLFPWLINDRIKTVYGRGHRSGEKFEPEYLLMEFERGASRTLSTMKPPGARSCLGKDSSVRHRHGMTWCVVTGRREVGSGTSSRGTSASTAATALFGSSITRTSSSSERRRASSKYRSTTLSYPAISAPR